MQFDIPKLTALVDEAKKNSKKRNFSQAMELVVNFKGLDVKAPENRINENVSLANPIGRDVKVCMIADGDLVVKARNAGADLVITKQELDQYAGNKKAVKKLADAYDYFAARTDLMATVGKTLGSVLGPRGKIPSNPANGQRRADHKALPRSISQDQGPACCQVQDRCRRDGLEGNCGEHGCSNTIDRR